MSKHKDLSDIWYEVSKLHFVDKDTISEIIKKHENLEYANIDVEPIVQCAVDFALYSKNKTGRYKFNHSLFKVLKMLEKAERQIVYFSALSHQTMADTSERQISAYLGRGDLIIDLSNRAKQGGTLLELIIDTRTPLIRDAAMMVMKPEDLIA